MEVIFNCPKCGTKLDDKHKQILIDALNLPQSLATHVRNLERKDCLCEECFDYGDKSLEKFVDKAFKELNKDNNNV